MLAKFQRKSNAFKGSGTIAIDVLYIYASPGIGTDMLLALFKNQRRRCDGRATDVKASTWQGFGYLVLAIVLLITVLTLETIIAGRTVYEKAYD